MMDQPDSNINLTVPHRRQHRRRMVFSGLVILAAGIALGIAGTLVVVKPTPTRPPMRPEIAARFMLDRFREKLNLTPEQSEQIREILRGHFQELERLREEARPQISKVFETLKSDLDGVLTEQQRDKWQRLRERMDKEFHRGMDRGPGGRGGRGRPGEGFRDGRGPFRGPGGPPSDGEGGPGEWRRDGRRPGGGPGSWRRRPDANAAPPVKSLDGQKPSEQTSDPNVP